MAQVRKDRVKETTTTTGTGALALLGAVQGFQPFSVIGVGNTCDYAIEAPGGAWETGRGTLSAASTLERTTIYDSSNGGAAVNLPAGTKSVFLTVASKTVDTIDDKLPIAGGTMTGPLSYAPGSLGVLTGGTTAIAYGNGNRRQFELRSGANTLSVTGIPASGGEIALDLLYTAGSLDFAQTIRWKIGAGDEATSVSGTGLTLTANKWYAVVLWNAGGTLYGVIA